MADQSFASPITSPHNPSIRYARSLQRRKVRQKERAFLVEGPRIIADAFGRGYVPTSVFFAQDSSPEIVTLAGRLMEAGSRVTPVTIQLIELLTDTEHPQGIVAVYPTPELPLPDDSSPLFVVADQLRDPGNLGTLMRSALAAGCSAMVIAPNTVDPYSAKVVRAAMGAHFALPLRWLQWHANPAWLPEETRWYGADPAGDTAYDRTDWTVPACLVVGGETEGLSDGAKQRATRQVCIPLHHEVESLNAGVAGSIILFEAARQRRLRTARGLREDSRDSRVCTRELG